jgi:undecaprenyl diphosphate synthase/tritrans,polycis-undecaprenyl-diphosphate synthase [geranylgeranyl-diphosphate specific]
MGAKKIEQFLEWCMEWPEIKYISIFALSTENLNRSEEEKEKLWQIYRKKFKQMIKDERIKRNGIQVRVIGDKELWRPDVKDVIKELVRATKDYSHYILNILLAYGSKFEINWAIKRAIKKPIKTIDKYLLVSQPLDIVIRTGGQHRLSNFMLYQARYSEIYFTQTLWPAFTKAEFNKIMRWYFEQQRKFGI